MEQLVVRTLQWQDAPSSDQSVDVAAMKQRYSVQARFKGAPSQPLMFRVHLVAQRLSNSWPQLGIINCSIFLPFPPRTAELAG